MKKETIVLVVIALLIGALIAIIVFFIFQSTRKINPSEVKTITIDQPSPSPSSNLFLTIDSPQDEIVVDERNLKISGKTIPEAKIIIITSNTQETATPSKDGSFSTDINLVNDENIIKIVSMAPNGETVKVTKVVSYSTENF
jgi:hypothetical protein